MAESDACSNQAFVLGRAIGLQFHLESNPASIRRLLENCADELTEGPYVQSPEDVAGCRDGFDQVNGLMERLLNRIESELGP